MLSRKLHLDLFHAETSLQPFLSCHQIKTHEHFFFGWGGLFNLPLALGMIYVNKNVHLIMQHPPLGSMTESTTNTPEILIPMTRHGQELSIYISLSSIKTADFMHPK